MPNGKKHKRHKMATHKRKKRLRKNRHKKKEGSTLVLTIDKAKGTPGSFSFTYFLRFFAAGARIPGGNADPRIAVCGRQALLQRRL